MSNEKFQNFLNGLKDLIAQAESGSEAPAEGEAANENEPAPEAAAEAPADETKEEQATESMAQGPSKVLARFMSKPKANM